MSCRRLGAVFWGLNKASQIWLSSSAHRSIYDVGIVVNFHQRSLQISQRSSGEMLLFSCWGIYSNTLIAVVVAPAQSDHSTNVVKIYQRQRVLSTCRIGLEDIQEAEQSNYAFSLLIGFFLGFVPVSYSCSVDPDPHLPTHTSSFGQLSPHFITATSPVAA
jgi:hypothetical protein